MKVKVCPDCGKHNSESAWNCADCGATLSMKTLIDTDDIPSESEQALADISPYFIQDVENVLETVIKGHETLDYGCNITQLASTRFGYLLITSHRLICVKLNSEIEGEPTSTASSLVNPWLTVAKELIGRNVPRPKRSYSEIRPSGSTRYPMIAVDSPTYPLTPEEEKSRKVNIYDLEELISAKVEDIGYSGPRLSRINANFNGDKKLTVTFYAPHHFEKVEKLLSPWLRKKAK